ncbi:MAG: hypothetical protein Kow0042_10340 [Calditrichia bacterium]
MKELIQHFETNSQNYQSLFNLLESKERQDQSDTEKVASLSDFISIQLAIEDEIVEFRLKKILEEEHPYIPRINVDRYKSSKRKYGERISDIKDEFFRLRRDLINLLSGTPTDHWKRTGVHEQEGHVSFYEFVRRLVKKDDRNIHYLMEQLNIQQN